MKTEVKQAPLDEGTIEALEFTAEDLAKIFHYPSVGQLFSDASSSALTDFQSRMTATRDQLEKIVRHGTREEADKAGIVVKSVNVTLDFLAAIQEIRVNESKQRST